MSNPNALGENNKTSRDHFAVAFSPLSLQQVYQLADDGANGAIALFSGMVRNQTNGEPVVALEYQAYEPMAIAIFKQIATDIRAQWPDITRIVIHHRTGKLVIGEISVLVAVGSPHRREAFAACQYAIDTLKHNAPIWKKEYSNTPDGNVVGSWVSIGACEEIEPN
ncbi:MAG: molybdenum cofactor biosynthesis protein MoaE [Cyanobacteria bacterium J06607_13]